MSKHEQLEEYFSQSLELDILLRLCPDDEDTIYQIVDLLVDTCATNRKMLRIAGDDKPAEVVRSRFMKLNPNPLCDLSAAFRRSQGFQNRSRTERRQEHGCLHRLPNPARSRLRCHAPLMPVLHSNHRGGDAYRISKTAFIL